MFGSLFLMKTLPVVSSSYLDGIKSSQKMIKPLSFYVLSAILLTRWICSAPSVICQDYSPSRRPVTYAIYYSMFYVGRVLGLFKEYFPCIILHLL